MLPPIHSLIHRQDWRPYPTLSDRAAWEGLPPETRQALIERGQVRLYFAWPPLPATLFLEYARDGNRTHYETPHFARRDALADLVMAECAEAGGRFMDDIANGIWTLCEESYWGIPAHIYLQHAGSGLPDVTEPTVDLFAAETAALLAWTDYLLNARLDAVSPLLRPRLRLEIQRRLLDPCWLRDDFWWMSFHTGTHPINNWNPWINSNWLACLLLLEEDEGQRQAGVDKILRSLNIFLASYGEAGGCDEGPGYWGRAGASLFDCLDLLYSATGTKYDVFDQPKIQNIGRFIYRTHIHDHYFVNFADASALNTPPPALVFRYGDRLNNADMRVFGAWLGRKAGPSARVSYDSLGRILPALFTQKRMEAVTPAQPLPRQAWFDDIQVLAARENEGSEKGFFLAAKGGHNAESHNHNDVGSFIVFHDGCPVLVDAGVETYSRKTFSAQRYEIWTMQSAYHNLLPSFMVRGEWVQQTPGKGSAAREVTCEMDEAAALLSLDLAATYPTEVGLGSWKRSLTLQRGEATPHRHDGQPALSLHPVTSLIQIHDTFELTAPVQSIQLALLTPCEVDLSVLGQVVFRTAPLPGGRLAGESRLIYQPEVFSVAQEVIPIADERLSPVWGESLRRIIFTTVRPRQKAEWSFRLVAGAMEQPEKP